MKILVTNGTEELLQRLRDANYQVEIHEDDEELFVEKLVEVEKPLPKYLTNIKNAVEEFVSEELIEKTKEYLAYKDKCEKIASIFKVEETEDSEKEEDE